MTRTGDRRAAAAGLLLAVSAALAGCAAALFRTANGTVVSVLQPRFLPEAGWLPAPSPSHESALFVQQEAARSIGSIVLASLLATALVCLIGTWVLVFTRQSRRKHDLATRAALGAAPRQLLRDLFRPLLRTLLGGLLAGLPLAVLLALLAVSAWPYTSVRTPLSMAGHALAGALLWSMLCALLTGVSLWLFLLRGPLAELLRTGDRATPSHAETRVREAFTALQVAVCVVVLAVGAVLADLPRRNPPAAAAALTIMAGSFVDSKENSALDRASLLLRMLESRQHGTVPAESIASAGAVLGVSLREQIYSECDNCPRVPIGLIVTNLHSVGPAYFDVVGNRILRGRDFRRSDDASSEPVAIVNDAFSRRVFGPRGSGLGRTIRLESGLGEPHRIIGVVEDLPGHAPGAAQPGQYVVYVSALQHAPAHFDWVSRTGAAPPRNAQIAWQTPAALTELRTAAVLPLRTSAELVSALALLCFLMGGFGLQATAAELVRSRQRDLWVRVAVGSTGARLLRHVVGYAARIALVGCVFGAWFAFGAQRILDAVLPAARISMSSVVIAAAGLTVMLIGGAIGPGLAAATGCASPRPRHCRVPRSRW